MRNRVWFWFVMGASLLFSTQSKADTAARRSFTLRECVEMAITRNFDVQLERLSADIARYNLDTSYGAYVPLFSFQARRDFVSQPADFDPKKISIDNAYEETIDTAGPTLSGHIPFGLSYDFSGVASERRAHSSLSTTNATFPTGVRQTNNYFAEAGINLRQHLLKDFWVDQDSTTIVLRSKDLKISEQSFRFLLMKTVLAVELAYYDLIVARENIGVQEKALQLRRQLVTETARRVQVGDLPPLDSEQAETQLQNTITAVTAARELFVSRQNALKNLLTDNFKDWADADLEPSETLVALPAGANRAVSSLYALKTRPDLIEARIAVEKNAALVRFRFNQLLPAIDAIGGYARQDIADTASEAFHLREPLYTYGVVLTLPLSNLAERGRYRATKADRQMAELQLKKAEQQVLVDIADLVNRVESRFSQVGSTQKARTYAESALGAEQKKLANGLSTSFIVLQLQETLTAARTAELQALADYNKAVAQLTFAEGRALDKYHLDAR